MPSSATAIRAATPADEALLSELIALSYATLDDGSYDRARLAAAMAPMSRANPKLLASGSYYVAEIGGEAAGCGGWSPAAPGTGEVVDGVAHIRHFATHPAHKRKGIAAALLRHCLDEARNAGVKVMKSQATLPAEAFYAAHGFRRVASVTADIAGNPLPAIDMELRLD